MADYRVRIGGDGPLSPDDVSHRGFPTVRRGYEPAAVRAFLQTVAGELRRLHDRIDELSRGKAPAASTEPRSLDIATLTAALGEETARVLRTAQEAAVDLRARAEEGASRALNEAHEEANRLRSLAETLLADRTAEAEAMAAKIRAEVEEETTALRASVTGDVEAKLSAAQAEADATVKAAVDRGREMVNEAQAARERMLTDLARRRKAALLQLEQLRAGRDRLLEAYHTVRVSLDDITTELERADREAREAAEAAARRAASAPEPSIELPRVDEPAEAAVRPAAEAAPPPAAPPAAEASEVEAAAQPAPEPGSPAGPEPPAEPELRAEPELAHQRPSIVARATHRRGRKRLPPAEAPPVASLPASAVGGEPVAGEAPKPAAPAKAGVSEPGVEQLFARIRADRAEASAAPAAPATEAAPEPEGAAATEEAAEVERVAGAEAAAEAAARSPAAESPAEAAAEAAEGARSNEDEAWLQRRDESLDPLTAALTRKIKRILQDEQNVVLDRLRTRKGKITAEAILPEPADQAAPYTEAAVAGLADAEALGATLGAAIDAKARTLHSDEGALHELAGALAADLLDPLRARLARSLAEGGADPDSATDAVNSAYREFKSRRIERAVGDQMTAAVSLGLRGALAEGTPVVWVVEDIDGPCPDCDDNALAGPTPVGEAFPTGQLAPPAHPGCRCLLGPPPA